MGSSLKVLKQLVHMDDGDHLYHPMVMAGIMTNHSAVFICTNLMREGRRRSEIANEEIFPRLNKIEPNKIRTIF